jgi:hypothetical protein
VAPTLPRRMLDFYFNGPRLANGGQATMIAGRAAPLRLPAPHSRQRARAYGALLIYSAHLSAHRAALISAILSLSN